MDYLLFHSQFSPSSKKLFDEFPALREKAISVDSVAMRTYVKKIHVVCVPTLLVLLGNRIIDRVIGYDSIYNWFVTTMYRMGQLQQPITEDSAVQPSQMVQPLSFAEEQSVGSLEPEEGGMSMGGGGGGSSTNLDDLILEDIPKNEQLKIQDRETPLVQTGMSVNTMLLAEQLKKERDNSEPKRK